MSKHYPNLPEQQLRLVQKLFEADPNYFNHSECPYADDTKELFGKKSVQSQYFDVKEAEDTGPKAPPTDDDILASITDIHAKLNDYWDEVKTSDKSADKNTFFRVSTSLLEKIVTLKKDMSQMKMATSFMGEVLNILGEVLTPDQRAEVMARLEKYNLEYKQ